jgi:hypothetical protein
MVEVGEWCPPHRGWLLDACLNLVKGTAPSRVALPCPPCIIAALVWPGRPRGFAARCALCIRLDRGVAGSRLQIMARGVPAGATAPGSGALCCTQPRANRVRAAAAAAGTLTCAKFPQHTHARARGSTSMQLAPREVFVGFFTAKATAPLSSIVDASRPTTTLCRPVEPRMRGSHPWLPTLSASCAPHPPCHAPLRSTHAAPCNGHGRVAGARNPTAVAAAKRPPTFWGAAPQFLSATAPRNLDIFRHFWDSCPESLPTGPNRSAWCAHIHCIWSMHPACSAAAAVPDVVGAPLHSTGFPLHPGPPEPPRHSQAAPHTRGAEPAGRSGRCLQSTLGASSCSCTTACRRCKRARHFVK